MQVSSGRLHELYRGSVMPHSWGVRISFNKAWDDDSQPFRLGHSLLSGPDLLMPTDDNPLQSWDYYKYYNYSERLIRMSWDRTIEFPYSVVSARADFELANTDNYLTPNGISPIASYVLPKRPVRLLSGFKNILIPQFVGLTQGMVDISEQSKTASFTALDFLTQIYDMPIRDTIAMRDVYTGEVLENIFQQFGLLPNQYDIPKGRNLIRFLFFERDQQTAGQVIRQLMEAEMGMLWLTEEGIIKFIPRLERNGEPTYELNASEIVSVGISNDTQIINEVNISAEVREVQDYQTVYLKSEGGSPNVVPPQSSYVFEAELQDPCLSVEPPTHGRQSSVSWFIATLPDGTEVTSGVGVASTELKANKFEVTIQNTNPFSVDISEMELWGQPAKVINAYTPVKTMSYQPSIDKYETQSIEIDNNFIQTENAAESLGYSILDNYAEYAAIIDAEIKGNPAMQLGDVIELNYRQYTGQYRIIGISCSMDNGKFTQNLKLRTHQPREWFTLNQSRLNSPALLAP